MKSFTVLAGLVGAASAGNWNQTWTHSSSSTTDLSSSSWAPKPSSSSWAPESSSSVPVHKPTGWVPESSSSSVPVHKPTGWVPESSSSVPVHKPTGWIPESSSSVVTSSSSWSPSGTIPAPEKNVTSTLITYVTQTVCPATTWVSGHPSVYTTTSTLTVTSLCTTLPIPHFTKPTSVPSSSAPAKPTGEEHNVTSTEYVSSTLCPVTVTTKGHTFTYTSTSLVTITSCAGRCSKPTKSVPAPVTSTEIVLTSTTVCPVSTLYTSSGKTYTKTYLTTSTILSTSTCTTGVPQTEKPTHSVPVAPYPSHNSTITVPVAIHPGNGTQTATEHVKTTTVVDVTKTLTTDCPSGYIFTTSGVVSTLTTRSVLTSTYTAKSTVTLDKTITPSTQGHAVPTTPIYSNGTTKYVTDVVSTVYTTCPSGYVVTTSGTTRTLQTPSVITSVVTFKSTVSHEIPATSVPEAPKPTTITRYSTTELTKTQCPSGVKNCPGSSTQVVVTTSYPVVIVETPSKPVQIPASSPVSPVQGSGKVTVTIPVTAYTTTCPATTVDSHGSTSVFLTTSVVYPTESKTSVVVVSTPSAPAQSKPVESKSTQSANTPVVVVPTTKPAESTKPVASSPVASSPVASSPVASSPVASSPVASSPVASTPVASSPVASSPVSPVQSTKPVASSSQAPAPSTFVSSAVRPSGSVVTQISDGQIQVPGPSTAPASPVASSAASSVASVLSSSIHVQAPSSTSGSVASATTSTPAQYTGAAGKPNASFLAGVAAVAAVFFF